MHTTLPDVVERMMGIGLQLAATIRDGDPTRIRALIDEAAATPCPDGHTALGTLAVALAALVPIDVPASSLLSWCIPLPDGSAGLTGLAVAGEIPAHALAPPELADAVRQLRARGMSISAIAEHLDCEQHVVRTATRVGPA